MINTNKSRKKRNGGQRFVIKLKVAEALQNDVGRGILRLDTEAREKIGVTSGDLVEIIGKRSSGAIVWQCYPQDEGNNIVRMDGFIRRNTGVSIGDTVEIKKAKVSPTTHIVIAPIQPIKFSPGFEDYVKRRLIGRPVTKGDQLLVGVFGTSMVFIAVSVKPKGLTQIVEDTEIVLKDKPVKEIENLVALPRITYEDIGGLHEEIKKVREMIELPLKHPELFERLGIEPPKGILLFGPPGSGKTLLAKAVATESEANFININAPEIMSKFVGEAEERLREVFKNAQENSPSIIFIDEIDAIAPKREEVVGEVERRVVAQLLTLMDGLQNRGEVVVIAATNRPNALDPALRRPGRFDREIELGVPDVFGRKEILQIHTRGMPLGEEVNLDEIATITHGYIGADLAALCKEAAMKALRRVLPQINLEEQTVPAEILNNLKVTKKDIKDAHREIQPSAMREVLVEIPNVKWRDIGGLLNVKKDLNEAIELPLKKPALFKKMGIRPPRGVFVYGPPGCGKTMIAKAVATESEANFISVKGPELLSRWVGESERAVRKIFKKARQVAPVIVFFDELDSIAPRRGETSSSGVTERVVNQILTEIDGIEGLKDVVIIAASNRPDMVDPALLRPGRFDKLVLIPAPDTPSRLEILKVHTKNVPLDKEVDLNWLAQNTEGYSGADLEALVREAVMDALREAGLKQTTVQQRHFKNALNIIKPSVPEEERKLYEGFEERKEAMKSKEIAKRGGYI